MTQSGSAVLFRAQLFRTKTKSFLRLLPGKGLEMKRTYLVKKDPHMPMREDNWIIMNAYEFHEFIKTDEGRKRRADFGQMDGYGKDDTIIIVECGKEAARKWRAEKDCRDYVEGRKKKTKYICNNLLYLSDFSRNHVQNAFFSDECYDMEEEVWDSMEREKLYEAVGKLAPLEKKLIMKLFCAEHPKSEEEIGRMLGISRQTVRTLKKLVFEKLRMDIERWTF